jgi:hypothetical protein
MLTLTEGIDQSVQSVSVKCSQCKITTPHEWIKVTPQSIADLSALTPNEMMEWAKLSLQLTKRLIICQVCGNMGIKN